MEVDVQVCCWMRLRWGLGSMSAMVLWRMIRRWCCNRWSVFRYLVLFQTLSLYLLRRSFRRWLRLMLPGLERNEELFLLRIGLIIRNGHSLYEMFMGRL